MKRFFLISLFLAIVFNGIAQYNYQSLISSAGDFFESENLNISWTLGEVATETYIGSDVILTQGFQQSGLTITGIDEPKLENSIRVSIYPNPCFGKVYMEINTSKSNPIETPNRYIIYDILGKLLMNEPILNSKTLIDLQRYSGSLYYLKLFNTKSHYNKTLVIQKQDR